MADVLFTREFLTDELYLPYNAIEDTIVENSRWSIHHKIIFEHDGKFYQTYYSVGATEMQYERPWEYEDKVKCTEVEKRKVMREEWVPVDSVEGVKVEEGSDV